MTANLFSIFELLGGLALFLLGMDRMGRGLSETAGDRLRSLLNRSTRHRGTGFLLGTALGTLAHSGPVMVIFVGFVNAGLLTLGRSLAPMMGANVGTTISMQLLSFQLDAYAYAILAAGFFWSFAAPGERSRAAGRAIMGFGLMFLGMSAMKGAVVPHREWIAPGLAHIDGTTLRGMLTGVALSAAVTGIIQSSGATIGITFAMASAGVFTNLAQVVPIVLGAHIGTCVTALLSCLGTRLDARRAAWSHLLFNLFNATVGMALAPLLIRWIPHLSPHLSRQIADVHTAVMLLGALLLLPLIRPFEMGVRAIVGRNRPSPAPSFLDPDLLSHPEQTLQACTRELRRVLLLTLEGMKQSAVLFFRPDRAITRRILQTERLLNDVKKAMIETLSALATQYLSRRQIIFSQQVDQCITDAERISDHVAHLADLSNRRFRYGPEGYVDADSFDALMDAFRQTTLMVKWTAEAFVAEPDARLAAVRAILEARDRHTTRSREIRDRFAGIVATHTVSPIASLYFHDYLTALDRIVQHLRLIALSLHHTDFRIKNEKLPLPAQRPATHPPIRPVDAKAFLARLDEEIGEISE